MINKCASMLLASLCLGVLLTGCGKVSDTGENTASAQAAEGTQKDAANKENVNKENGSQEEKAAKQDVRKLTFVLDWTPNTCLLYTSPSPRDRTRSRMPSSA